MESSASSSRAASRDGSIDSPLPHGLSTQAPLATSKLSGRTLVLCFDGTSKRWADDCCNSNVIRLFEGLDKLTNEQICYYQPGIGTYVSTLKTPGFFERNTPRFLDQAFAICLDGHIKDGYTFLMENYMQGDRICIFGYSRGAYIARCLAGMLQSVGLLPKGNAAHLPFAYSYYKKATGSGESTASRFKQAMSRVVEIDFLGVWDTVTSVGFTGRTLPFTAHSNIIKTFRQALALDERRCQFRPNPWSSRPYNVSLSITIHAFLETVPIPLAAGGTLTEGALTRGANHETALSLDTRRDILHFDQMLSTIGLTQTVAAAYIWGEEPPSDGKRTDSREVWFAGDHADVGGGSQPLVQDEPNVSNPSLLWMIQQVQIAKIGIKWTDDAFTFVPTIHAYLYPPQGSESAPPEKLSPAVRESLRLDAQMPIQDNLSKLWSPWWPLEWLPSWSPVYKSGQDLRRKLGFNGGRSRVIQYPDPLYHISVKMRSDGPSGYQPRARRTMAVQDLNYVEC